MRENYIFKYIKFTFIKMLPMLSNNILGMDRVVRRFLPIFFIKLEKNYINDKIMY